MLTLSSYSRPFAPELSTIPSSSLFTSSTSSIDRSHPSDAPAILSPDSWLPSLRSMSSMRGLLLAETGDSMVELDLYPQPGASGYRVGHRIDHHLSPAVELATDVWQEETVPHRGTWMTRRGTIKARTGKTTSDDTHGLGLATSDTLLQISAPPHKSTSELRVLLGNSTFRLKRNASVAPPPSLQSDPEALALERAKPRARVELDIVLESETCVQGNPLKGHITIHVRKNADKKLETPILLSKAKVRVVGYEAIPHGNTRCTFYQCTALLPHVAPAWDSVLASPPDPDGWAEAKEGIHVLPFSLTLPADGTCGIPKGTLDVHSGVALKYFAMVSLRLKDPETSAESVSHFYRCCEIWPRLSFASKLSPAPRPLVSEAAKTVFMGGTGKVRLSAAMHRLYWVAGQRCAIHLRVVNESKKTVKGASITLWRTTTVFKPLGGRKATVDTDPDACETTTMRKAVAVSVLAMGQKCAKGHASAKGWWSGVRPGDTADFVHHIILPPDTLSVTRVRLLEVEYTLNVNVTTGGLSSDVQVTLPIRIINFLSIDPPSISTFSHLDGRLRAKPQLGRSDTWYRKSRSNGGAEETVPGMKYSSTDMTVVAQGGDIASDTTHRSDIGSHSLASISACAGSPSDYPTSDSADTITQRMSVAVSLDEIDRVIGTDSRIHSFVTGVGQLTGSGSTHFGPHGSRASRLASLPEAMIHLDPQEESTPRIETARHFVGRQPDMTRTIAMPMPIVRIEDLRMRSSSDLLTTLDHV